MDKQYKILALCVPAMGHLYPMTSLVSGITRHKNVKVIMYGNEEHRKLIESTGAEFRHFHVEAEPDEEMLENIKNHRFPLDKVLGLIVDTSDRFLPELVRCVEEEEIDLILYDFFSVYGKWLIKYLRNQYEQGKLSRPPPKAVMSSASFIQQKGIYPNSHELNYMPAMQSKISIEMIFRLIFVYIKYTIFCFKFGFKVENLLKLILEYREELNLCTVVPEIQPRAHLFPKNMKFIGSSASEEVRGVKELPEPLKSFLAPFEPVNPLSLSDVNQDEKLPGNPSHKLIYASFGTVGNQIREPYDKIFEAIRILNQGTPKKNGLSKVELRLLIACGDKMYAQLEKDINEKKLILPANILLVNRAPQLDVLKRASLYITHSGQGSTNEAVHYGVPMICLPIFADQPSVAYRVADELGLGVRLDFDKFTPIELADSICEVLNDSSYLQRSLTYAKISRRYDAVTEGPRIILEFLQEKQKTKSD